MMGIDFRSESVYDALDAYVRRRDEGETREKGLEAERS